MADDREKPQEPSPDTIKGPGGLTMRQIYEQVQRAQARDRDAAKTRNALAQKEGRWRRFMHYVWDRKKS